jgi:hypothetical protein
MIKNKREALKRRARRVVVVNNNLAKPNQRRARRVVVVKITFGEAKSKTPSHQKNANQDCSRLASFYSALPCFFNKKPCD